MQHAHAMTPETARAILEAGADTLVAGSATFYGGALHYAENIAALRHAAANSGS